MYWVTGILGLFMMVAPFVFGYGDNTAAMWTGVITGVIVAVASYVEGARHDREAWEYWVAGIVGVFVIASPFILGFNTHSGALWTSLIVGLLVALMAGSRLWAGGSSRSGI